MPHPDILTMKTKIFLNETITCWYFLGGGVGIAFVGFENFFSSLFLFKSLFALVLGSNKKVSINEVAWMEVFGLKW